MMIRSTITAPKDAIICISQPTYNIIYDVNLTVMKKKATNHIP